MRALPAALALLALVPAAQAQVVRHGALDASARAKLAAATPRFAEFVVDATPSGEIRRIRGPLDLMGETTEQQCADFIARFAPIFGAVEFGPAVPLIGGALRFPQRVRGVEVLGHGLTLRADLGEAHGSVSLAAAALPAPGAPATYVRTDGGAPRFLRRVDSPLGAGLLPVSTEIRADDGSVERVFENLCSGQGNYHHDGSSFPFATGSGKGWVYGNVKAAIGGAYSSATLPDLSHETLFANLAADGMLFGRFVQLFDGNGLVAISSDNHQYYSSPWSLLSAWSFNHVNAYFQLTRFANAMTKILGELPTDYAMPVIVNAPDTAQSYYSPADLGLGHGPGFLLFGSAWQSSYDLGDDFSRDPSLLAHEYVHAIFDKAGIPYGSALPHTPPRAVHEAIADYFAASHGNDPRIGPVLASHASAPWKSLLGLSGDSLRNLADEVDLYDDLFDEIDPSTNFPEEHQAGTIFGASLWRARTLLKAKLADSLIGGSIASWPLGTAEVGFPIVDESNFAAATAAFYFACLEAVLDRATAIGGPKLAAKALGPLLANGAVGNAASGTDYLLDASSKGSLSFASEFLGSVTRHDVRLYVKPGTQLDVSVLGSGADKTMPAFTFSGEPGQLSFPNPSETSKSGTSVKQKGIVVNAEGACLLSVFRVEGAGGRYRVTVRTK